jgi:RNA polymerase sigma factor (TIGR02999 family)
MGNPEPTPPSATGLLTAAAAGDREAAERLLPLVYAQLRAIAQQRMAVERPGHTLQATALVHEAYARIARDRPEGWIGQGQFFAAAAEAMRRILIEHARARGRVKRGGGETPVPLDLGGVADLAAAADPDQILALDDAIRRVSELDEQMGQVVRLRFYAGLTVEQTAAALGISPRTVKRDWTTARAMLYRHLAGG